MIGINRDSEFVIVEVKSTIEDYRGDQKWQEYLPYCERFFFAVPESFPHDVLPRSCGLIVADSFGAAVRREPPSIAINANRKRRQLLRFARQASARLQRAFDPGW